ncbi:MAG: glycosyl hydrolase family 65 protein, partial [Solirubrobacteraceae bacterium]
MLPPNVSPIGAAERRFAPPYGDVSFEPRLPAEWTRLRFRVQVRAQLVA